MAAKTGNKQVSETVADSVKIPTANSTFWTMTNSIKAQPRVCDDDEQPEVTRLAPKTSILSLSIVDRCPNCRSSFVEHGVVENAGLLLEFRSYLSWLQRYK